MGRLDGDFQTFFTYATRSGPFAFQQEFANKLHQLVNVPTGLGKTAMVVVGWLWRRNGEDEERKRKTPRRLVYCLPMRVLVEQTRDNVTGWIKNLRDAGVLTKDIPVHVLMGGEEKSEWDIHPERDAIIIGTQDMLLSRALNRGYAMSRARWPMAFGLLHTDCLWVFDEIQLMGSGLATTAQLEAFRRILPYKKSKSAISAHGCQSVWMSATMCPEWLKTVDFKMYVEGLATLKLSEDDRENAVVKQRIDANKPLSSATARIGDSAALANEILTAHKVGTRTIVVVNTVRRACELFAALTKVYDVKVKANAPKATASATPQPLAPQLALLHSRYRPEDRTALIKLALVDKPADAGTIIVSTQVIEAGVDVSATTLFTEVAPWASLVQRFGRCNRYGDDNANATIHWIPLPENDKDAEKVRFPYELEQLRAATVLLNPLEDAGLLSLPQVELKYQHTHVIRQKDLVDLFDTTPDLAGNDIDIDRFIRDLEETDVRVFWREWDRLKGFEPPPSDIPAPRRNELCSAPVGEFREFAKDSKRKNAVWRWDFLNEVWLKADAARIAPGQVYLVHADAGGYSSSRGWDPKSNDRVNYVALAAELNPVLNDGNDSDNLSQIGFWQTIAQHTDDVCKELNRILEGVQTSEDAQLRIAARWHDWGKAHEVFQGKLPDGAPIVNQLWAKAPGRWKRSVRKHFRHELASAIAVLDPTNRAVNDDARDLVAYLIAAHHGKVRLSIRSLPEEKRPTNTSTDGRSHRFARGVWDADTLPPTNLGGEVTAAAATLSLEPMEFGLCEKSPFADQPSWLERTLGLRDTLGPFHLAYLEAILRAADMRASKAADNGAVNV